jgi:hypothetical protein
MRRSALGVLSLAIAAALGTTSPRAGEPASAAAPQPQAPSAAQVPSLVAVEKDLIDLGEVTRGAEAKATFVLRNEGAAPVKILSAKPG